MTDMQIYQNWHQGPVEWAISQDLIAYEQAVEFMEARVGAIRQGDAPEMVWLLEHPPLYTAGTSAQPADLLMPEMFPVHKTGRGGQYTYHGPGQRVVYVMLDLTQRKKDVRRFVQDLEQWVIMALADFNVRAELRDGRIGVWVDRTTPGGPIREDKIAAIGIRLRRWVSFHGIAINVEPDLTHFSGITPCGIAEPGLGVTSLVDLGLPACLTDMDHALANSFQTIFGPLKHTAAPQLDC